MTPEDEKNWLYEQYNLTHDQVKDNEISLLYTKWNETKMENERLSAEIEGYKKILKEIEFQVYGDWPDQEKMIFIKMKFPKR